MLARHRGHGSVRAAATSLLEGDGSDGSGGAPTAAAGRSRPSGDGRWERAWAALPEKERQIFCEQAADRVMTHMLRLAIGFVDGGERCVRGILLL